MSGHAKRKRVSRYSEEALCKAVEDVKSGATYNAACRKYKVPRTTLHARVTNKHSSRLGAKPAVGDGDEADLARWVERMCSMGCSVSRNQIGDSVVLALKASNKANPFVNKRPGKNWFDRFIRSHRLGEKVRETRRRLLKGAGVDATNEWFSNLNDRLRKERLQSLSRKRTYCIGEFSLPMQPKTNSWCAKEGPTVIVAANAAGELMPPMIVFDSEFSGKLPRAWSVESNENADMTPEHLYNFVKNHLHAWLVRNSVELPIVLFLYQYLAAYMSMTLCDFCDKNQILLAILPSSPHRATTPVEIKLFPILRREFIRKLRLYVQAKRIRIIGKNEFVERLEEALDCTNVEDNLENGFHKCGLYPLSAERYIRACVQLGPDEDIGDIVNNEKQSEEITNVDQSSVLKCIETNLDSVTIESFRSAIDDPTWTGKIEDTNLFNLWRKIKKNVMLENRYDDSFEPQLSDSSTNENEENRRPSDYTSRPKRSVTEGKHNPLGYIDNNFNSQSSDRNISIIVVNPDEYLDIHPANKCHEKFSTILMNMI